MPATNSGTSRPRCGANRTTTVASSIASAPAKSRSNCWAIGWPLSFSTCSEKATSWAVSFEPS